MIKAYGNTVAKDITWAGGWGKHGRRGRGEGGRSELHNTNLLVVFIAHQTDQLYCTQHALLHSLYCTWVTHRHHSVGVSGRQRSLVERPLPARPLGVKVADSWIGSNPNAVRWV